MPEKPDADALHKQNIDVLHDILGPLKDYGVLSEDAHEKINRHIETLLGTIHRMGRITAEEDYWKAFQMLFGFAGERGKKIPMNAANLCPEPKLLLEATSLLRMEYNNNVAQQVRMGSGERVRQLESARENLARSLRVKTDDLAILRNASEGNNAINCGYRDFEADDNVVLWKENHPTNLAAWKLRAHNRPATGAGQFKIRVASDPGEIPGLIDGNTRFVSFSETSNGSGERVSLKTVQEIWEKAHPDCHVHIDGTMAWGAADCRDILNYCHSFVSSAHKWFLGPKETGILYMKAEKAETFMPSIFAYNYKIEIGDPLNLPKNAHRFELIGQRDDVNIITLLWTQQMWNQLASNPFNPYRRVTGLAEHLKKRLLDSGGLWRERDFITPLDPSTSRGVVRVHAPKGEREVNLYDYLYKVHGIAGSGDDKTFRLCPHIYNTKADIDKAVEGMNHWKGRPSG